MYSYNLIIKIGHFESADALVNRELTNRFGPDVHYYTHAKTDHEVIVVVSDESKRNLQHTLGEWFTEDTRGTTCSYLPGTLLHYRQILRDEPSHILNQTGV